MNKTFSMTGKVFVCKEKYLNVDAALEAVVCNAMLQDDASMMKLYKGNRTLFERVMDWVREFLDEIKATGAALAKRNADWKQMDALKGQREMMQGVMDRMTEIMNGEVETEIQKNHSAFESGMAASGKTDETNVVKLSAKESEYDPETAAIKEQIANSKEKLNTMDIVASATVPENMRNKRNAAEWAIGILKSTGYRVDRKGFGVITFNENDIRYAMNYANTEAEKAAIAVLPKVLKRGIEIARHNDHKKRTKQTVTFAAPVELNGVRGNMAVVVNLNGKHYYTHRIVLPDGSVFKFGAQKRNSARIAPGSDCFQLSCRCHKHRFCWNFSRN